MDFPRSVPSVGLVDGKFVDEDVVAGTPGSLIPAQWGNAVSYEFLNVIESAGFAPDEDNNAQLLAAINIKIAASVPASPPDASVAVKGLVELATNTETQAGTDAQRAVTPASLASTTATATRAGLVELATEAETQAGTDAQRAVTPAGLASTTATVTRAGLVELATNAETQAGTDSSRAITLAGLSSRVGTESIAGILQLATQAEAEAGTESSKAISVIRVWQAITRRFATQSQVNAGTDDTTMVTPLKMRAGFSASIGLSGFIALPTWMGGLIFQWMFTTTAATNHVLTLPLAAPTELLAVIPTCQASGAGTANIATWDRGASTLSSVRISTSGSNNIAIFVICR